MSIEISGLNGTCSNDGDAKVVGLVTNKDSAPLRNVTIEVTLIISRQAQGVPLK